MRPKATWAAATLTGFCLIKTCTAPVWSVFAAAGLTGMSVGVGLIATEKVMENNQNSRNKVFDIEVDDSNPVDFAYITDYSPIEDAVILPSKYHTCLGRMRKKAPVKEIHKCCQELATARVELNGTGPLQAFEHDTRFEIKFGGVPERCSPLAPWILAEDTIPASCGPQCIAYYSVPEAQYLEIKKYLEKIAERTAEKAAKKAAKKAGDHDPDDQ